MSRYAAIVLAAGRGSRFTAAGGAGATKLVAAYAGEPLVRLVARAALASSADPVIVVTGHAQAAVEAALVGYAVQFVHNGSFAEGLSTSLQRGLAAAPANADGVLVLLGDMPEISSHTIDRLIERADRPPPVDAVVPVHGSKRGNPVLLRRSLFARLLALAGDQGARQLLDEPTVKVAEVAQPASILADIDRPEDLLAPRGRKPESK